MHRVRENPVIHPAHFHDVGSSRRHRIDDGSDITRAGIRRCTIGALLLLMIGATASPTPAQVGVHSVRGQITERGSNRGIAGATVRIGDDLIAGTDSAGAFEARGVRPGRYSFVVEALGYQTVRTVVNVDGTRDITATIVLDPAPINLDSLTIRLRRFDVRGRVADRESGRAIPYAELRLGERGVAAARDNGTFTMSDVGAGHHELVVEAFGWLPRRVDIEISRDTTLDVVLESDGIMTSMIAAQVERLSERSRGVGYALRSLERDDILTSRAPSTLAFLKGRGAPIRECTATPARLCLNDRPPIVFIDDIQVCGLEVLDIYPLPTIQRFELIGRERSTIRAYTTWYIERMTRGEIALHPFTGWERPLPCASG